MKVVHTILDKLSANSPEQIADELTASLRPLELLDRFYIIAKSLHEEQAECIQRLKFINPENTAYIGLKEKIQAIREKEEAVENSRRKVLKMLPPVATTSKQFDELIRRIEAVASLAKEFKEEMRINSLHLRGKRRSAYAKNCWYIIDELTNVCNFIRSFIKYHEGSQVADIQKYSTRLSNAIFTHVYSSGTYYVAICLITNAFTDYFSNTKTVLSKTIEYDKHVSEVMNKQVEFNGGVIPKSEEEWADLQRRMESSDQSNLQPESIERRKKGQLTHKQQFALVELLNLHNHPLLINLTPKQRGTILGELLNRSVDDTVNMLNLEVSKGNEKLNWNTDYNRGKVRQFLQKNGIELQQ